MEENIIALLVQLEETKRFHDDHYRGRTSSGSSTWSSTLRGFEDRLWDRYIKIQELVIEEAQALACRRIVFRNSLSKILCAELLPDKVTFKEVDIVVREVDRPRWIPCLEFRRPIAEVAPNLIYGNVVFRSSFNEVLCAEIILGNIALKKVDIVAI